MIVCDKCGTENSDTGSYCYRCGERLSKDPEREEAPAPAAEKPVLSEEGKAVRRKDRAIVAILSLACFAISIYILFGYTLELEGEISGSVVHETATFFDLATNDWDSRYLSIFWMLLLFTCLGLVLPFNIMVGTSVAIIAFTGIVVSSVPVGSELCDMAATNTSALIALAVVQFVLVVVYTCFLYKYWEKHLESRLSMMRRSRATID